MKKFFVTLFFLLVLAGAGFFFGWAQLTVPPGEYGLVRSKTHGVDSRLVQSGEFRWIWYKLIPTNVEIIVFRLDPVNRTINIQNTLPSGGSYARFAGIAASGAGSSAPADFSWEIKGAFSFRVNPEGLVSLAREQNFAGQEALNAWEVLCADKIEGLILAHLSAADMGAEELEELIKTGKNSALESEISRRFPDIRDFSFTLTNARLPNFALYKEARSLYEHYIARQQEYLAPSLGQQAQNRINSQLHFDELERYGELLEKYPVLLEYLALEKGIWSSQNQK